MAGIVGGMTRLMEQLNQVGLEFTTEDLIAGAEVIQNYMFDLVPVDTGFLRDSIFILPQDGEVLIGAGADYASYIEFGTYKMEAQPFLRPALDEGADEALSAIVDSVQSHMKDITA